MKEVEVVFKVVRCTSEIRMTKEKCWSNKVVM